MEPRVPLTTYEGLARMIDHALVDPQLTEAGVVEGCELAKRYGVASVAVRPCDIDTAVRLLDGSSVQPGAAVAFPHGSSTTATKLYEARELLRRGARVLSVVLNYARLRSREFQYVESELTQLAETCHKEGALLKVIFENSLLSDELKIVACRIAGRAGVDFAQTATGFAPGGYTPDDVRLMRKHLPEWVGVAAAGGVRSLEVALEAYELGCDRIGATRTAQILDEWKAELAEDTAVPDAPSTAAE